MDEFHPDIVVDEPVVRIEILVLNGRSLLEAETVTVSESELVGMIELELAHLELVGSTVRELVHVSFKRVEVLTEEVPLTVDSELN